VITTNFHTHTVFCDGKNTPEEMVLAAIEKGFTVLGFSGHSFFEPQKDFCMSKDSEKEYFRQVTELKEKYKDKITILCGIEQDIFSLEPEYPYDYRIGSVHNVLKNGVYYEVDASPMSLKNTVDEVYGRDFDSFAEEYFSLVESVLEKTNADIIGHIDLISKYSEQNGYKESARFLKIAEKTVKKLVSYERPFEINTGAMSRKARSIPYPSPEILKLIKKYGGNIIFSSDCHDKDYLDYGFCDAVKLALDIGFTHHAVLTQNQIKYEKI